MMVSFWSRYNVYLEEKEALKKDLAANDDEADSRDREELKQYLENVKADELTIRGKSLIKQIRSERLKNSIIHEGSLFTIDAQYSCNVSRFCNHSCMPNMILLPVSHEAIHGVAFYTLGLFALRDIQPMEELVHNYGTGFMSHMQCCLCGSADCLKKPSEEWRIDHPDWPECQKPMPTYGLQIHHDEKKSGKADERNISKKPKDTKISLVPANSSEEKAKMKVKTTPRSQESAATKEKLKQQSKVGQSLMKEEILQETISDTRKNAGNQVDLEALPQFKLHGLEALEYVTGSISDDFKDGVVKKEESEVQVMKNQSSEASRNMDLPVILDTIGILQVKDENHDMDPLKENELKYDEGVDIQESRLQEDDNGLSEDAQELLINNDEEEEIHCSQLTHHGQVSFLSSPISSPISASFLSSYPLSPDDSNTFQSPRGEFLFEGGEGVKRKREDDGTFMGEEAITPKEKKLKMKET